MNKMEQSRHLTINKMEQSRNLTMNKMEQSRHLTMNKMEQSRHLTMNKTEQSSTRVRARSYRRERFQSRLRSAQSDSESLETGHPSMQ